MHLKNNAEEHEEQSTSRIKEIWVNSFCEASALKFREQVLATIENYGTDKPITIYIDSYGGSADALASMLETMDEAPNQFITVVVGKAMSAGAILLSHGDHRFCGQYSRVMVHELQSALEGNVKELSNNFNEIKRLNLKFMELLAKNCGMPDYKQLQEKFKEKDEVWMSAEEALEFGVVDYVGLPRLTSSESWSCMRLGMKPSRRDPKAEPAKEKKPKRSTTKKVSKKKPKK